MRCSVSAKECSATCSCEERTVFEGAAIGQVFTGSVRLTCPGAQHAKRSGRNITSSSAEKVRLSIHSFALIHLGACLSGLMWGHGLDPWQEIVVAAISGALHGVFGRQG